MRSASSARRDRLAVGHRLVQAELVADQDQRRRDRRAEIADELAHELFELRLVDSAALILFSSVWLGCLFASCASPAS